MDSTVASTGLGAPTSSDDLARGGIRILNFASVAAQLALVLVLLRQFQIENAAFRQLAVLTFAGFAVHAFLPLSWRLPFFAALSLASVPVVLGGVNGAWVVTIGFVLIAACHLPVSIRMRAAMLLGLGAVLIAQRAGLLPAPWSAAIWPILGSMFMFRLIVYFYDLRHDKAPTTPAQSIGYFFMLPNACFPLFPVVDFKTFKRSHYAADAHQTYQKGVDWIVRGVIHLILYRYIYYYATLAPSEVVVPADLLQYLVANFMLYLRVSGLFHLIVGMLYLFGFHLPETHNRYLLASSFTDFWRRINIYWKDFMQKIFYFPAVFALKRFGTTWAITIGTMYVFVLTWFLHSYQWFWLRGTWLFVLQDILFWTILGVLVVANSLYEIKYGRSRSLGKPVRTWRGVALGIAKIYATFWFICVLWSFWTVDSITAWLSLWSALSGPYHARALMVPAIALIVIAAGAIPLKKAAAPTTPQGRRRSLARDRAVTVACLLSLIVVSISAVHQRLGTEIATVVHSLRSGHLSRLDNAKLERGYYEGLLSVDKFNSQLWEVYSKRPANWMDIESSGMKRFVGGFGQVELIPSFVSTSRYGTISINRWGMRDKDYAKTPAPGTFRAVVLGPSSVMGWGVGDGETFEALLEAHLNKAPLAPEFSRVELLNFGIPGYQPPQQLVAFERAIEFRPNAVVYVATGRELRRSASYITEAVLKHLPIPEPGLQAIIDKSGVRADMDEVTAQKHLEPYGGEILSVVYGSIAQRARDRGIRPVWVFLPQVRAGSWQEETPEAIRIATAAGFAIVNLENVYSNQDPEKLRLAEWDDHPNVLGHQVVAQRLYREFAAKPSILFGEAPRKP